MPQISEYILSKKKIYEAIKALKPNATSKFKEMD